MTLDEMISDLYYVVHKSQMATLELGDESARQLLRWLEDYKELKEDYIELDRKLREANSSLMEVQMIAHHSDWIPCIERLPNVDGNYVVMRGNAAEILEYSVEMESFGYTDEYKDELGYNITEWYTVGGVSDWMPIPPKEGGDHDA